MSEQDKFRLTLQSLPHTGRQWDEVIPLQDLVDESFADMDISSVFFSDMAWQGSLYAVDNQFFLQGSWQMRVPRVCGKCCVEFGLLMSGDVDVMYALGKSNDVVAELKLTGDEPELLEDGELNILDVLREHFWLAWQPMVMCAEDCKGLCFHCGTDLNQGSCHCQGEVKENAFSVLKHLKFNA